MVNCESSPISFSTVCGKRIEASFSGGNITTDGGVLLVSEVDKHLGCTKKLSKLIRDTRDSRYIQHSIHQMLKQRVFGIALGYEDVSDHNTLRDDVCFQIAVNQEKVLASSSTLCRFENNVDRTSLVNVSKAVVELFIDSHKVPPKELILDFDPTDNQTYGHQEKHHYHGYYKHDCFLPMHVFCGDHLLVSLLRPSNIDGAKYSGAILRLLVERFRQVWPNVNIMFRGDSAFARKRIFHWCEKNNVEYIVGIAGNSNLQKLAAPLVQKAKQAYKNEKTKQRMFDEWMYGAASWDIERRVIAKAEHHKNGDNLRFVVTNMNGSPQALYDDGYCPRGNMENGIKQLKLDLHSDRNSCTNFLANQFRLLLSSIAYLLISELRRSFLFDTKFSKSYCQTIRLKLFKIGAVILKKSRRIQILLSSMCPYQKEFSLAATRLVPT